MANPCGTRVRLTDSGFGEIVDGWLWRVFADTENPDGPCEMFTVLPFAEAGTENVWEGRRCRRIAGPSAPPGVFSALTGSEVDRG